jgi:hypothetical protein
LVILVDGIPLVMAYTFARTELAFLAHTNINLSTKIPSMAEAFIGRAIQQMGDDRFGAPRGESAGNCCAKNCNLLHTKQLGDWHSSYLRSRGSEWLRNGSGNIRAAPAATLKVRCDVTSVALRKAGEEEKVARSKAGSRQ